MKTRIQKIKNVDIECNAGAIDAWQFSQRKVNQYQTNKLSFEIVTLMQQLDPLHVIKNSRGNYEFFAGWHWLVLAQRSNIDKISAIIYDKPIESLIKDSAWAYLLNSEFKSSQRKHNLAYMSDLLKKVPKNLNDSIYQNFDKKSFELLSSETLSAVKNQKNISQPDNNEESILNQILGGV